MKKPLSHAVRTAVLGAALSSISVVRSADGQEVFPAPVPLQPTASFWGGEITVKGACSAFGLDSNPEAARTCQSIPMRLSGGKMDQARQLADQLGTELPEKGGGHYWLGILQVKQEEGISALRHFHAAVHRSSRIPMAHPIPGL